MFFRINVLTTGKYDNVVLGYRYCFFKKSVTDFIKILIESEADFTVERFISLSGDMFGWVSDPDEVKVKAWKEYRYPNW